MGFYFSADPLSPAVGALLAAEPRVFQKLWVLVVIRVLKKYLSFGGDPYKVVYDGATALLQQLGAE